MSDSQSDELDEYGRNLVKEYCKLSYPTTTEEVQRFFRIVLDTGMLLNIDFVKALQSSERTEQLQDAMMLFQMTMLKGVDIAGISNGVNYQIPGQYNFKRLVDPHSIAVLARNQLESVAIFNNIFLSPNENGERDLLYILWVIAGLNTRQKFVHDEMLKENKDKASREAKRLVELKEEIKLNPFYKTLPKHRHEWLEGRIKARTYEFQIMDGDIKRVGWQELFKQVGPDNKVFNDLYMNLSMYSHPSNVSVFQFGSMYHDESFVDTTNTFLRLSGIMMSFMIRDFCALHPKAQSRFENMPPINQLIIESYNRHFRGNDQSLIPQVYNGFMRLHGKEVFEYYQNTSEQKQR